MNTDQSLTPLLACTGMNNPHQEPQAHMLVVGDAEDSCSFILACRDDSNRVALDAVLLPDDTEIVADAEEILPHHPAVVIRSFENMQMVLCPRTIRAMAQWLLSAADWLDDVIDGGD